MRLREFLLLLLVCWTAVGAIGVTVSFLRQQQRKALRNLGWIVAVWVVYLGTLLGVSLLQTPQPVEVGTAQCFGDLCFTVTGADEMPGYLMQNGRLLRVKVNITNRGGKPESEPLLHAYLLDTKGRRWAEVPGLSGIPLKTKIPAGGAATSGPVFKLPADATPRGLVLTRGRLQPGLFVIGDPDSLLHRPIIASLGK